MPSFEIAGLVEVTLVILEGVGIDQLNCLSTNNAKLDIRPGSAPGSSVLVIMSSPRHRVTGSFSSDDTGTDATGLWQGTAMSRATSVSYSIPYGWWTGSLSYSESAYAAVVPG
jgi:hemolysin activation/secretion protein